MRRRWWRSAPAAFAAALLLALLVTGGEGYLYDAHRASGGAPVGARVGQTVTLAGTQVVVRSITVAPELPAEDAGDPPAKGPKGSVLVLVTWQQTIIGQEVPLDAHFCAATLVADDGTVWTDETDYTYGMRRPKALTCSSTEDAPLVRHVVRTIGQSYVIPAAYASRVRWRLSWDEDAHVVTFSA